MNTRQSSSSSKKTARDAELSNLNLELPIVFEADSATRVWQWLDKKMSKQTESINQQISQFYTTLRESETRLTEEIRTLVKEAENRLLNEIDKRFCDIREELTDVTDRVTRLETVMGENIELKNEIRNLKIQSLKHSNSTVACDLRINGIPFSTDENLQHLFGKICNILEISIPPLQFIHRLQNKNNKSKGNSPDGVIIARLLTPYDKNFVLKSLSVYKKKNNHLRLNLLGFDSDNQNQQFYINENLTNGNFKILRQALALKKQRILQSAYSFRGLVYVKRLSTDQPFCVVALDTLDNLFRSNDDNNGDIAPTAAIYNNVSI